MSSFPPPPQASANASHEQRSTETKTNGFAAPPPPPRPAAAAATADGQAARTPAVSRFPPPPGARPFVPPPSSRGHAGGQSLAPSPRPHSGTYHHQPHPTPPPAAGSPRPPASPQVMHQAPGAVAPVHVPPPHQMNLQPQAYSIQQQHQQHQQQQPPTMRPPTSIPGQVSTPQRPPPPPPMQPRMQPNASRPYSQPPGGDLQQLPMVPPPQPRLPPTATTSSRQYPSMATQSSRPPQPSYPSQPSAYPPNASSVAAPDPLSHIPRPLLFTEPQQGPLPVYAPQASVGQAPPPASTRYVVYDDGNASPKTLRSTVYAFPANRNTWKKTGDVPLGLCCLPLAAPGSSGSNTKSRILPDGTTEAYRPSHIPPIQPATAPPPRCSGCQAYANPYWAQGVCNFCGRSLTQQQQALPTTGTVEYLVDGPYITRATPVQAVSLYALDLTSPHVGRYLALLEQLATVAASDNTMRLGLCLFSASGVVLCRREQPNSRDVGRYTYMSDVTQDPFCPLPLEEWTYDVATEQGKHDWCTFLQNQLTTDWEGLKKQAIGKTAYGLDGFEQSCGGAALAFLAHALEATGGRGTVLTWRRPNFGVGRLAFRQVDRAVLQGRSRNEDPTLYMPLQKQQNVVDEEEAAAAKFYQTLGEKCVKNRITLDIILHTGTPALHQFYGMGTLGEVCQVTNGKLLWVTAPSKWEDSLFNDLARPLQQYTGWDAVFKVRCSAGVQVKSVVSKCGIVQEAALGGSPEVELSSVNPQTCLSVELEHRVGGIPKTSSHVYFQTALLYTELQTGQRLVRVSTLALSVTNVVHDVFRSADLPSICTHLALGTTNYLRQAQGGDASKPPRQIARDALYYRCLDMLVHYRQNTPAIASPSGQLLLPESLQLLPLFCLCLHKRPTLCPALPRRVMSGNAVAMAPSGDERAYYNWHLSRMTPETSLLLVYPHVFALDAASQPNGVGDWTRRAEEGVGVVQMPPLLIPSMETLQDDGIYLIDDGIHIYLYIGKLVPDETKRAVCCDDQKNGDPSSTQHVLPNLLWQMRTFASVEQGSESDLRPTYPPVHTVIQREGHQGSGEADILSLMVEDANAGEKDYAEFLRNLHRRTRDRQQQQQAGK